MIKSTKMSNPFIIATQELVSTPKEAIKGEGEESE
jgi:hypothetical protein